MKSEIIRSATYHFLQNSHHFNYVTCSFSWLDISVKVAQIVASFSIVVALVSFFYNKNKDKTVAAVDQMAFFRKDILPAHEEFVRLVKGKKGSEYVFSRVRLDIPTIQYTRENFIDESRKQAELFSGDFDVASKEISILNMLEEISVKMLHFKTTGHTALNSIKTTFVELVENHAAMLLIQRELGAGMSTYSSILEVYSMWKSLVDRRSLEEKMREALSNFGE